MTVSTSMRGKGRKAAPMEEGSGTTPFLKGVKSSLTCMDDEPFLSCLAPKKGLMGCEGKQREHGSDPVRPASRRTSSAGLRDGERVALLGAKFCEPHTDQLGFLRKSDAVDVRE